jgi:hypothetical protein
MIDVRYEWDEDKNIANIKKHGVSFKEARYVFDDPNVVSEIDDEHSYDEKRLIVIGKSKKSRILYVCFCERDENEVIRIISARKADRLETDIYFTGGY